MTASKGRSRSRHVRQPAQPGTMVGAAMVSGIVFPPCFMEEGVRINTGSHIRMLDDVCLPHCMARFGTDTSSRWW